MDLDYDSEIMEEEVHVEEFVAKEEPIDAEDSYAEAAEDYIIYNIDLIPLVYTTRLDQMVIFNSNTSNLQPEEVTAAILKESKPKLQLFPNDNCRRGSKKTFSAMKKKLKEIYHQRNFNLETSYITLELPEALMAVNSVNCEMLTDPKSTHFEADSVIKREVLDEPISACEYSELLKLCRPCSVVLLKLDSHEVVKPVISNVRTLDHVNETNENQNFPVVDSSSDDEPLITLNPDLRSKLESNDSELVYGVKTKTGLVKVCKPAHNLAIEPDYQKKLVASFQNRILADAVIEVMELYSKECSVYCYNRKGYLLEYYREKDGNALKNKHVLVSGSGINYFPITSCCWVQRDAIIKSLYPKVLLYSSLRFMRQPHTCPAGECSCCCQKRQIIDKPDIEFTDDDSDVPFLKKAIEVEALENEIQTTIIQMNKEPRINPTDMLRNVLDNPNTKLPVRYGKGGLIDKALLYKKPLPRKPINNRCLVSLKLESSQSGVIVLRNFAADEREIYELNPDGEVKSYLKLTCFNNTDRPDVKKLLQKTKQVNDVCCWFKRENLITELIKSKMLHHSAVKFIRTRHTCTGNKCNCCCEPAEAKEVTLTGIKFPLRPKYWPKLLDSIRAPPKPSTWLDNYVIKPAVSSVSTPAVSSLSPPAVSYVSTPAVSSLSTPAVSSLSTPAVSSVSTPAVSSVSTPAVSSVSTPAVSSVSTPAVSSAFTPAVSPPPVTPRLLPKLAPKSTPAANKFYLQDTPALVLDNRFIKPASFYEANTTSTKPTTDEDCQFVGVRSAPTLGLEQNSTPIEQPNNTTNALGDDLSKEVNTLITSILDRFKDVRLTINSEGKVAAALNTPVSNLTTVELKVLANILSYAQSQVNSLGLNTGMSLSNIINLKVGDQQTTTSIDPTMHKGNVNLNNLFPGAHVNPSFNTATANIPGEPDNLLDSSTPNIHDMNDNFSKSLYTKNKEYTNSFTSLLSTKLKPEDSNSGVPVIKNVFSLQDQDIKIENETSSAIVLCRRPANQNQLPKASKVDTQIVHGNTKKRPGITNTAVTPPVTKKIRVLSPSKLGAVPLDKINSMVNSIHEPLSATQTHTLEVDGARPELPLLSNNFQVVPEIPPFQQPRITKPRIIRQHNFKGFAPQPSIVVSPLQVASCNDNIVEESPILGTVSAASVGTSTEDIEIPEAPIKIEQDFNEEDDCILGV